MGQAEEGEVDTLYLLHVVQDQHTTPAMAGGGLPQQAVAWPEAAGEGGVHVGRCKQDFVLDLEVFHVEKGHGAAGAAQRCAVQHDATSSERCFLCVYILETKGKERE